ncbi:AAA family ATPase [Hymenobacter sp. BT683]|uniref:AAA family ATPase n=1 Tax=Hymenobacter jeongseonensis TaxID=2791027 RepID=A0ABS0IEJ3_9BACT|nr:AAA family ATPase [Hymenobacter jeongseonensis]MBF9236771.1 AAA family ATPase [Hymenobacter jeongseonensis]
MSNQIKEQGGHKYLTPGILQEQIAKKGNLSPRELGKFISARTLLEGGNDKMATLLDPILPKTGLVALVGSSDTGKSAFLRQLALAVALRDKTFMGLPLSLTHGRAVYVSTEDDQRSLAFLTRKQIRGRSNGIEEYEGLLYLFEHDGLVDQLDELLSLYPVDLIVLDAFSDLFEGRLNDSQFVRAFFKPFHQLTVKHDCLIVLLHHTGKYRDEQVPSKHHVVGSQAFEAKMRMVMELRVDPIYSEKRHLCILKGNYLGREDKKDSYVLTFDDDLTFQETGERQSLETLTKLPNAGSDGAGEKSTGYTQEKCETAAKMRNEGKPLADIAEALGYANKSTVSRMLKKFDGLS